MRLIAAAALTLSLTPGLALAQRGVDATAAEPFKLGTFEIDDTARIGIVLQDKIIVDLAAANRALQRDRSYPAIAIPADMRGLIAAIRVRDEDPLYEIVDRHRRQQAAGGLAAAGLHQGPGAGRQLAPLMPGKMLKAAVNFYSHVGEGGHRRGTEEGGGERRPQPRQPVPVHQADRGRVIGNGDNIVLPCGRDRIDWEVELGIVIGRARQIRAGRARPQDYVFGYTVTVDISDRGGRPPGGYGRFRLVRRQGPRHLRADGAVDRPEGVLRRSDEEACARRSASAARRCRRPSAGDMIHSI